MIVDLQGVPQLWRIVSFIGLGLLMLGVAVAYSRVSALWHDKLALEDRAERNQADPPSAGTSLPCPHA